MSRDLGRQSHADESSRARVRHAAGLAAFGIALLGIVAVAFGDREPPLIDHPKAAASSDDRVVLADLLTPTQDPPEFGSRASQPVKHRPRGSNR